MLDRKDIAKQTTYRNQKKTYKIQRPFSNAFDENRPERIRRIKRRHLKGQVKSAERIYDVPKGLEIQREYRKTRRQNYRGLSLLTRTTHRAYKEPTNLLANYRDFRTLRITRNTRTNVLGASGRLRTI